jgi:prepilin-type N-terminal cleavage/methylation domain-containing protein
VGMTNVFLKTYRDKPRKQKGFSLIELSVVISVAAAATVGYLSWTQPANITDAQKAIVTKESIEEISKAIEAFRVEKGRLPCPADPYIRIDNTRNAAGGTDYYVNDYGVEDLDTNQATVNGTTTLGVDCPVNIGSVPVHSLGLSNKYINDGWNKRFTYQVSKNLCYSDPGTEVLGVTSAAMDLSRLRGCTKADYLNGGGGITVTDGTNTLTANAAYVLVSHGANGKGAFLPSGEKTADSGNANEAENTNGYTTTPPDSKFIKATISSTFDDLVYFKTKTQIERLTDRKAVKQISVQDCEANSLAISQIGIAEATAMSDNITDHTYGTSYNNGQQVALGILMAMQSICVKDYGAVAATINGKTWSGAKCPVMDVSNPSIYDGITNSCSPIPAFRPTDLANLRLWLDLYDSTTLYTGSNCTTGQAPTSGTIGCWKDKNNSGTLYNATQATANLQPTYVASALKGNPGLLFNGTSTYMNNTTFALGTTGSFFAVAATNVTGGTYRRIITNEANFYMGLSVGGLNYLSIYGNGSAWVTTGDFTSPTALTTGTYYVLDSINNGTDTPYVNGVAAGTPRAGAMSAFSDGYHIGMHTAGGQWWSGYIAEIIIYNAAISAANRQSVERYLGAKWGIVVP